MAPALVANATLKQSKLLQVSEDNRWVKPQTGRLTRYFAGLGSGAQHGVFDNCLQNLIRGITERVLYVKSGERFSKPPQPLDGAFDRLASLRDRLLRKTLPTPIVDRDEFPLLYDGRRRGVYERAVDSLKTRGLTVADSYVSTFLKAEKVNLSKADPVPRVIQPRSPRYNVEVGRYLKLFEKSLCAGFKRVFKYPVILKGMNADQVGTALHDNWKQFRNPVAIGLDASRFDQHVSQQALKWEHSVYNSVFKSDELRKLLEMQLVNRGIGRVDGKKVDYTVQGCRMSGDMNTGMGNCLIMSSIVIAYFEKLDIPFRLSNNGDDCVVFMETHDLAKISTIDEWFLDFGFKLTRETPCFRLEEVEFCQFQPVQIGQGWRCVRNPYKAMSKDCVALVPWDNEIAFRSWANAIASCGKSLTAGVPVWSSWYGALGRIGRIEREGVNERINESGMAQWSKGCKVVPITEEARASFYYAFGIMPEMQIALEEHYDSILDAKSVTPVIYDTIDFSIDNQNPISLNDSKIFEDS